MDIAGAFLRDAAAALQADFPGLPIHPVEGGLTKPIALPDAVAGLSKLRFFPGTTIGNLVPRTAVDLLRAMKATLVSGAYLLIGMDRLKYVDVLARAYDDAAGFTAEFNLILPHLINAEQNGTIHTYTFPHPHFSNNNK